MNKEKIKKTAGAALKAALAVVLSVVGLLISGSRLPDKLPKGVMRVYFFDVGQGDCTLVVSDDAVILVDVPLYRSAEVIGYLERMRIRRIDWFVISHFDADHCGDAAKIVDRFEISHLLAPEPADVNDPVYADLIARTDGNVRVTARAGQSYTQGGIVMDVLSPGARGKTDNESCAVCRLVFGGTSLLLCSDADIKEEKTILSKYGGGIRSDVIKIAHHGSKYSSSADFLRAVSPSYAVISCGPNYYGHPTTETLDALEAVGAEYIITQANGVIIFDFDGKTVARKK